MTWSPEIGDPTIGGWVTVVLYFIAAAGCWRTAARFRDHAGEWRIWITLCVSLLLLGINKQLDLQSALTDIGRVLAHSEHWYEKRQAVQLAFVAAVGVMGVVALVVLLVWSRRAPAATRLAIMGTAFIVLYVVIRAASFHHVDRFIGRSVLGFRWNWIIEMGGIAVVIAASFWRGASWHGVSTKR